jgi:oligopeptidase B
VYEEPDPLFRVDVFRTKSRGFLVLHVSSHTTSEVRYLRAEEPAGTWSLVAPRRHEHEYDIDHWGDLFYVRTNDRGRNFRLATAPVADPRPENWTEVVAHRADVMLEGIELFADHLVLSERTQGVPQLTVTDLRTGASHAVAFPEPAFSVFLQGNREWDTPCVRYNYQSLVTPSSVFDYDMDARAATLLKRTEVPGGFDPAHYASERIAATAGDGVRVPVSLVYRRGVERNGSAPLLLTGYGAYGFPELVAFSPMRLALLDRGVIFAIAHVRGGGEMGRNWYDQGKLLQKANTFTDFVACARHLAETGWTSPDRIVAEGGSAGGLLVGAVANMAPEQYRAIVSQVPFVDVVTTMLDPSIPLTTGEYDEWGDPNQNGYYEYMLSYSPYDNVERKAYPALLITGGLHDSQVQYWEPAKWTAKLREFKTDSHRLLLKTNMDAGHGGASGRFRRHHETAFSYAFLLDLAGIKE